MNEEEFLKKLQRRLAQTTIGAPAIRNQGAGGLVKVLRDYFEENIFLDEFIRNLNSESNYSHYLNSHTAAILQAFPRKGRSWGAARKGLNLFFREIVYCKFFSDYYGIPSDYTSFNRYVRHLEVPLDRDVATAILKHFKAPKKEWTSIRSLSPVKSQVFQLAAQEIADEMRIARVNLDVIYWRGKNESDEPN